MLAAAEPRSCLARRRLFFGDNDGSTVWDCDCRPSDGLWLALKARPDAFSLGPCVSTVHSAVLHDTLLLCTLIDIKMSALCGFNGWLLAAHRLFT